MEPKYGMAISVLCGRICGPFSAFLVMSPRLTQRNAMLSEMSLQYLHHCYSYERISWFGISKGGASCIFDQKKCLRTRVFFTKSIQLDEYYYLSYFVKTLYGYTEYRKDKKHMHRSSFFERKILRFLVTFVFQSKKFFTHFST